MLSPEGGSTKVMNRALSTMLLTMKLKIISRKKRRLLHWQYLLVKRIHTTGVRIFPSIGIL